MLISNIFTVKISAFQKSTEKEIPVLHSLQQIKKLQVQKSSVFTIAIPANYESISIIQLKSIFGDRPLDDLINMGMYFSRLLFLPKDIKSQPINPVWRGNDPNFIPIAKSVLETEKKYWNYAVFYRGQEGIFTLLNDIMQALYTCSQQVCLHEHSRFLDLLSNKVSEFATIDDFLATQPEPHKLPKTIAYDDHLPEMFMHLLSVNYALFGNSGNSNENTWYYFKNAKSVHPPKLKLLLTEFFKPLNADEQTINEILQIHSTYLQDFKKASGENLGILLQIFIDPAVLDSISYLCVAGGIPLRDTKQLIDKTTSEENKKLLQELQPLLFDEKLKRLSVSKFLQLAHSSMKDKLQPLLNILQARLYLKYSIFFDPEKVKIIVYQTPSVNPEKVQKAEKKYKEELRKVIEKILQKNSSI